MNLLLCLSVESILGTIHVEGKFFDLDRRESAFNLRDSENKLNILLPRTNYYKNSFNYCGAILWNSLPRDLREAKEMHKTRQS